MSADRSWKAVGHRLINGTATSALVGSVAIWHGEKPDPTIGWPAINFFRIPGQSLTHKGQRTSDLYQISCRAETPAAAENIGRAVQIEFQNLQDTVDGFDVDYAEVSLGGLIWEPEDAVYHVPCTLRIDYTSSEG